MAIEDVLSAAVTVPTDSKELVIPLVEEQLTVTKRTVETGTVRLHVHTEEVVETVEAPLLQVQYGVEHVQVTV